MKIYFLLIFLFGLTWGQSSSSLKQSEVITERYPSNGLKKTVMVFEGEGINEIKVAEYGFFENGLKSYIKSFNNNALNGKSIRWYENGNKAYEGIYKNNMKNGLHQSWFFDGSLENSINYSDDNLNGEYQEFHTNGNVLVEGNYENGQKEGLWLRYYDNEKIQEKTNFKDGKLDGLKTTFLKNGDTKEEMTYRNDKKWTGIWVLNHNNGQKSVEGKYENGKGIVTEWFNTGDIYKKIDYDNDKKVGETIYRYFKNWGKKSIEIWEDNKKNGLWTNWNEKGEKIKEGTYINNLMEGEWYFSFLPKDSSNWRSAKVNYQSGNGTNPNQNSGIPENGRVGKFEDWYDNGKKAWEYYYNDDGTRDSEKLTKRWYKNGNKWSEGYNASVNNKVINIGKYTEWHKNGKRAWEYYYNDDGTRDSGKLTAKWYEDGSKWYEGYVLTSNDKILWNGLYKEYYINGNLKSQGKYDKGKKTGEWTYWSEDGRDKATGLKTGIPGYYARFKDDQQKIIALEKKLKKEYLDFTSLIEFYNSLELNESFNPRYSKLKINTFDKSNKKYGGVEIFIFIKLEEGTPINKGTQVSAKQLKGVVYDKDGYGVKKAIVTIYSGDKKIAMEKTDRRGGFSNKKIRPGKYSIEANHKSFGRAQMDFILPDNQGFFAELYLSSDKRPKLTSFSKPPEQGLLAIKRSTDKKGRLKIKTFPEGNIEIHAISKNTNQASKVTLRSGVNNVDITFKSSSVNWKLDNYNESGKDILATRLELWEKHKGYFIYNAILESDLNFSEEMNKIYLKELLTN